jgi:hypothetical protein
MTTVEIASDNDRQKRIPNRRLPRNPLCQDLPILNIMSMIMLELIPNYPLGGSSSLRERWRPHCGHFGRLFVVHGIAMDSSQATKLPRNPPRHHLTP